MANRHRHRSNKRIDHSLGFVPCEVCEWLYGPDHVQGASETHECFFGSAYLRNTSMDYGAQVKVCSEHHRQIHANNLNLNRRLQQRYQQRIMNDRNMSMEEWIAVFGKSYL